MASRAGSFSSRGAAERVTGRTCLRPALVSACSIVIRKLLFQALEALGKTICVRALCLSQSFEPLGEFRETFFACRFGHPGIHLGVFVGFTLDGRLQIGLCIADRHARCRVPDFLQKIQVTEGMAGLCFRRVPEQPPDIGIPLNIGALAK